MSEYKSLLQVPQENIPHFNACDATRLARQVPDILPDLSDSSKQGRLPVVVPEDLENRLHIIKVYFLHLLPVLKTYDPPGLSLTLENCHSLVLQALAASAQSLSREELDDAAGALRVPSVLLSSIERAAATLNSRQADDVSGWLAIPREALRILVAVFQHCRDCGEVEEPLSAEYQRCLRELFEECKAIMGHLEEILKEGSAILGLLNDTEEVLLDTAHLLANLVNILPKLDSRYFGRMARVFVGLGKTHRHLARTGRLGSEPGEVFCTVSSLALDHARTVKKIAVPVGADGDAAVDSRKLDHHAKKLSFLLRLMKDMSDVFCDDLGSDLSSAVAALSIALSLNDAKIEFNSHVRVEVRQAVTAGISSLAKAVLDELSIDQGFASFVFSPDFETKALMNATKESGGGESAYELCHLLAFLLHRVPYQNDGTRRLWMGGGVDGNLFRSVISVAGECSDFNRDPFVIGVEHSGKGIQAVGAYEHVVSLVQSFVIAATAKEMEVVEQVLMRFLLRDQRFWSSKLIADVWCFIGRYGPPEYCCSHAKKLFELLLEMPPTALCHGNLAHVASRMSALLSDSGSRELEAMFLGRPGNEESESGEKLRWSEALSAVRIGCCGEAFKRKALEICLADLRAFSKGDVAEGAMDRAPACCRVLANLWPELGQGSAREVRAIVEAVWQKLASGVYVPGSSSWCSQLLESLCDLTAAILPNCSSGEKSCLIEACWSVVSNSAYDPVLCFLFSDLLSACPDLTPGEQDRFWKTLLLSSSSDALLEFRCLHHVAKRVGKVGTSEANFGDVGNAMRGKLLQALAHSSAAGKGVNCAPVVDYEAHVLRNVLEVTVTSPSSRQPPPDAPPSGTQSLSFDSVAAGIENAGDFTSQSVEGGGREGLRKALKNALEKAERLPPTNARNICSSIRQILAELDNLTT